PGWERTPPPGPLPEAERGRKPVSAPLSASGRGWGRGLHADSFLLLVVPFRFLDELVQRLIDGLLAGTAEPAVADHALVIQHEQRRGALEVPGAADNSQPLAVRRVGKRAPVELLLIHHVLELLGIVTVGVDADQGKGLLFHRLDERPLVGP